MAALSKAMFARQRKVMAVAIQHRVKALAEGAVLGI